MQRNVFLVGTRTKNVGHAPETHIVEPVTWIVPVPVRDAGVPLIVVPPATAHPIDLSSQHQSNTQWVNDR